MPVSPTYPGVYVEEIPSGVRTITGVATSITAFMGRARRGPTNEPVTINSFGDFERAFGGLWSDSTLSYAVRDFYLNGGSQAIIVRLFNPYLATQEDRAQALAARPAAVAVAKAAEDAAGDGPTLTQDQADAVAKAVEGMINNYPDDPEKTAATTVATDVKDKAVKDAQLSDVKQAADAAVEKAAPITRTPLSVHGISPDDASAISAANAAAQAAFAAAGTDPNATLDDTMVAAITTAAKDKANSYKTDPAKTTASDFATSVKNCAEQEQDKKVSDFLEAVNGDLKDLLTKANTTAEAKALKLEAASEGAWGNALQVRIDYDVLSDDDAQDRFGLQSSGLFNLTVRHKATGVVEKFRNVSVVAGPRQVDQVLENESNLVRVTGTLPPSRPDAHPAPPPDKGAWDENTPPTYSGVAEGEQAWDGNSPGTADYKGSQDNKTGLYALDKADLFNLLCIPPAVPGLDTDNTVYGQAIKYCVKRRAMLIVDSPSTWSANKETAAATARNKLSDLNLTGPYARNAALYFPRVLEADPLREGRLDTFVPCGIIAGNMARTDTNRGVWKAPAGLDAAINGVQALEVNLNDDENGMLNPLGINCLRFFPVAGRVVWGARTLRGADQLADEYKYIPVRRTALFIEESLYRGLKWVVFEPNDEPLWAQIRLNVGAFMHNLFRQGAFQGTTPREAYFVKCDKETTTQNDINLGIVNIVVGFAPLKPAEFVIIQLQQMAGQIEV
jgi:phage tail sheath protein FI